MQYIPEHPIFQYTEEYLPPAPYREVPEELPIDRDDTCGCPVCGRDCASIVDNLLRELAASKKSE